MIFWRVFMRISYSCPAHLKFSLTIEGWSNLVQLTGDAIDWLDQNDKLYDVWMLVAYAATSCALVQVRIFHMRITNRAPILCILRCGPVGSTVPHVGTSPRSGCCGETQEITRLHPTMGKVSLTGSYVCATKGRLCEIIVSR